MAQASKLVSEPTINDWDGYVQPKLCRISAYPYRQLIDNDIRLLNILPGHGTLECVLHQMPLAKEHMFYALSYTWGNNNESEEILLDGEPFKVTRNLHEALQQFRERPGSPAVIGFPDDYFWVDAICLNQDDVEEKARQVPRMMEIYHAAISVIIWLGPNKPMTRLERLGKETILSPPNPIGFLRLGNSSADSIIRLLFEKASSLWTDWELPDDIEEEESVLRHVFSDSYSAVLHASAELLQRPWFERIWTFQECSLGIISRVFAGRHGVYLNDLIKILRVLAHHHRLLIMTPGFARIASLIKMEEKWHSKQSADLNGKKLEMNAAECLLEILSCVIRSQATNPQDRVYGLISFVTYFVGKDLPIELKPNYHQPFEVIYWQYAAYLLQNTGDLRLFLTQHYNLRGVPSWVPDFRSISLRKRIKCESTVRVSPDKQMLHLQGIRLQHICDVVSEWTDPFAGGMPPDLHYRIRHVEGRIFKLASQIRNVNLEVIIDDFLWRACRLFEQGGADGIRRAYTNLKGMSGRGGVWIPRRKTDKTTDAFGKDLAIADEMHFSIVLLDDGTVLSVSRRAVHIRPDDLVCIFKGATQPTIIRHSGRGGSFSLMGHCEIMSGTFYRQPFDEDFWADRKLEEFQMI
ncbi:heterokaryon incompatibility protein-domain-containing protein [Xylaria cf. heliscus]|nr:heterokaryon incompatibility protein-domain-containing protein [Xylaria cf. heliscus]